jgi:hypothetical protein
MPLRSFLVAVALAFAPSAAWAEIVLGAALTDTSFETVSAGTRFEAEDRGYKLVAGWNFAKFFGLEAGYLALGSPEETVDGARFRTDLKAYDACALGILPMGVVRLHVKAGMARWTSDSVTTPPSGPSISASENGTDPVYGAGAAFHLLPTLWLRTEYETVDAGEGRSFDVISLGLDLRF